MLNLHQYRAIVRASAYYDLIVTAAFATPWSFALAHTQLSRLNQWLGGAALPEFSPFHLLFACLMASVVLVWSLLRLLHPQPHHGRYDASARLLFSTWMLWTLHATGAPLLCLFVVPELAWGVAQWLPYQHAQPSTGAPLTPLASVARGS